MRRLQDAAAAVVPRMAGRTLWMVRHLLDGVLVRDPEAVDELALALGDALADPDRLDTWGRNAQRHVRDSFSQLEGWLKLLGALPG